MTGGVCRMGLAADTGLGIPACAGMTGVWQTALPEWRGNGKLPGLPEFTWHFWIPACAGMTDEGGVRRNDGLAADTRLWMPAWAWNDGGHGKLPGLPAFSRRRLDSGRRRNDGWSVPG